MVERLIVENDRFRLFWINGTPEDEWVNFRVKSVKPIKGRIRRSRLGYSRVKERMALNNSYNAFKDKNPEGLDLVLSMIQDAVKAGLV